MSASLIVIVYLGAINFVASVFQGVCGFGDTVALQVLWHVGVSIAPGTFHGTPLGDNDVRTIALLSYARTLFMQAAMVARLFYGEYRANKVRVRNGLPPRGTLFNGLFALSLTVPAVVGAYVGLETIASVSETALRVVLGVSSLFFAMTLLSLHMMGRLETRRIQEVIHEDLTLMRNSQLVRLREEALAQEARERQQARRRAARQERRRARGSGSSAEDATHTRGGLGHDGGDGHGRDHQSKGVSGEVPMVHVPAGVGSPGEPCAAPVHARPAAGEAEVPLATPLSIPPHTMDTGTAHDSGPRPPRGILKNTTPDTAVPPPETSEGSWSRPHPYPHVSPRSSRGATPGVSPTSQGAYTFPPTSVTAAAAVSSPSSEVGRYIRARLGEISREDDGLGRDAAVAATTLEAIRAADVMGEQLAGLNRHRRMGAHDGGRAGLAEVSGEDEDSGGSSAAASSHSGRRHRSGVDPDLSHGPHGRQLPRGQHGSPSTSANSAFASPLTCGSNKNNNNSSSTTSIRRNHRYTPRHSRQLSRRASCEEIDAAVDALEQPRDGGIAPGTEKVHKSPQSSTNKPVLSQAPLSASALATLVTGAAAAEVNVGMREVQQQQLEALQRGTAKSSKRHTKIRFVRMDGATLTAAIVSSFVAGLLASYTGIGAPAQMVFVLAMNMSGAVFRINSAVANVPPAALRFSVGLLEGLLKQEFLPFYVSSVVCGLAGLAASAALRQRIATHGFFMSVVVSLMLSSLVMLTANPWVLVMGVASGVAALFYTVRREQQTPEYRIPPAPPNTPTTVAEMDALENYWEAWAARMGAARAREAPSESVRHGWSGSERRTALHSSTPAWAGSAWTGETHERRRPGLAMTELKAEEPRRGTLGPAGAEEELVSEEYVVIVPVKASHAGR